MRIMCLSDPRIFSKMISCSALVKYVEVGEAADSFTYVGFISVFFNAWLMTVTSRMLMNGRCGVSNIFSNLCRLAVSC